jgi:transposase
VVIGYEESSQLDVEPAKYFVLVTKREKRACRSCEEHGVVAARLPQRIIEKCLASDRIVIDTVVSKYCDHTPLHRQSVILERDLGLEISRATLDGWVLKVGELLIAMVAAMRRELISGTYIQADETPVDVQMHEGRGKNHQAYCVLRMRPSKVRRKQCFTEDEGRPLGTGLQEQVPNHLKLLWLRARVVSVEEKAELRLCQVRVKKANASEPLMKCRKMTRTDVRTGV